MGNNKFKELEQNIDSLSRDLTIVIRAIEAMKTGHPQHDLLHWMIIELENARDHVADMKLKVIEGETDGTGN